LITSEYKLDGPLEENAATLEADNSSLVKVRVGSIFATGELLETISYLYLRGFYLFWKKKSPGTY
jgi:hypothetical protein